MDNLHFQIEGCNIRFGHFESLFNLWFSEKRYSRVFIIADSNTVQWVPTGFQTPVCIIPAGEQHKDLDSCEKVWKAMIAAGLDRNALVLNFGGGVVGDLGGFCAATYKRGIDFVQAPTTLLAMTDAAIGGKLGIGFQGIKNTIGIFRQPEAVLIDPSFLVTLPERELRSGMAEVFKHALIGDPDLWRQLATLHPAKAPAMHHKDWLPILQQSVCVKVAVVLQDPFEKGLRALLNFGHTIGHALESWFLNGTVPLTHGEAVAAGMLCETALKDVNAAEALAGQLLPWFPQRAIPETAFAELWAFLLQDKKNRAGMVRAALPGDAPFTLEWVGITQQDLESVLRWYNGLKGA